MEEVSKKRKFGELEIETASKDEVTEQKDSIKETGFAAYSKINPFALGVQSAFGAAAGSGFGSSSSGANASNPFAALGKAVAASSSSSSSFGVGKQSWLEGKNLTLTLPSPKSPKHNPFSTPSPVHNPFVTVVNQHQDELWKAMAQKQLENTNSNSNQSQSRNSLHSFRSSSTVTNEEVELSSSSVEKSGPPQSSSASDLPDKESQNEAKNTQNDAEDQNGDRSDREEDGEAEHVDQESSPKVYKTSGIHLSETTVISGEEDETCIYQGRAKLYRFKIHENAQTEVEEDKDRKSSDEANSDTSKTDVQKLVAEKAEWCEIGTGPIKILSKTIPSARTPADGNEPVVEKERIVMRREEKKHGTGFQLILNVALVIGTSFARHTDNTIRMIGRNFTSSSGAEAPVINTYLIRFKGKKECDDFFQILEPRLKRLQTPASTPMNSKTSGKVETREAQQTDEV